MITFLNTTEKTVSENYPYGFRLKTKKYDFIEYKRSHGFRHGSQTVNPKTGRLNAPKYSTYYTIGILYRNEDNHIKFEAYSPNSAETINHSCKFMHQNFDLFTAEQISGVASELITILQASFYASKVYGGLDPEILKPYYLDGFNVLTEIQRTGENLFNQFFVDSEKIDSLKDPNFNPFKITAYGTI
jgi:hypothetical protein